MSPVFSMTSYLCRSPGIKLSDVCVKVERLMPRGVSWPPTKSARIGCGPNSPATLHRRHQHRRQSGGQPMVRCVHTQQIPYSQPQSPEQPRCCHIQRQKTHTGQQVRHDPVLQVCPRRTSLQRSQPGQTTQALWSVVYGWYPNRRSHVCSVMTTFSSYNKASLDKQHKHYEVWCTVGIPTAGAMSAVSWQPSHLPSLQVSAWHHTYALHLASNYHPAGTKQESWKCGGPKTLRFSSYKVQTALNVSQFCYSICATMPCWT